MKFEGLRSLKPLDSNMYFNLPEGSGARQRDAALTATCIVFLAVAEDTLWMAFTSVYKYAGQRIWDIWKSQEAGETEGREGAKQRRQGSSSSDSGGGVGQEREG